MVCSALVASSAAGAVALSVLHDITGDRQVRTLSTDPVLQVEPRFVIPSYVPETTKSAVVEVALREAPELVETSGADTAPVAPAPVVVTDIPSVTAYVVPRDEVLQQGAKPSASPKAVEAARTVRKETVRSLQKRQIAPVIVAQSPAFIAHQPGTLQPGYSIGVYR